MEVYYRVNVAEAQVHGPWSEPHGEWSQVKYAGEGAAGLRRAAQIIYSLLQAGYTHTGKIGAGSTYEEVLQYSMDYYTEAYPAPASLPMP